MEHTRLHWYLQWLIIIRSSIEYRAWCKFFKFFPHCSAVCRKFLGRIVPPMYSAFMKPLVNPDHLTAASRRGWLCEPYGWCELSLCWTTFNALSGVVQQLMYVEFYRFWVTGSWATSSVCRGTAAPFFVDRMQSSWAFGNTASRLFPSNSHQFTIISYQQLSTIINH